MPDTDCLTSETSLAVKAEIPTVPLVIVPTSGHKQHFTEEIKQEEGSRGGSGQADTALWRWLKPCLPWGGRPGLQALSTQ